MFKFEVFWKYSLHRRWGLNVAAYSSISCIPNLQISRQLMCLDYLIRPQHVSTSSDLRALVITISANIISWRISLLGIEYLKVWVNFHLNVSDLPHLRSESRSHLGVWSSNWVAMASFQHENLGFNSVWHSSSFLSLTISNIFLYYKSLNQYTHNLIHEY